MLSNLPPRAARPSAAGCNAPTTNSQAFQQSAGNQGSLLIKLQRLKSAGTLVTTCRQHADKRAKRHRDEELDARNIHRLQHRPPADPGTDLLPAAAAASPRPQKPGLPPRRCCAKRAGGASPDARALAAVAERSQRRGRLRLGEHVPEPQCLVACARACRGCWPGRARMQRRGRLARIAPGGPEAWRLAERELGACCQPAPGGAGVLDPWGAAPAPVTMLWPSGEVARKRTREVCPASVATGVSAGYRHSSMAFVEYPAARAAALTLGAAAALRRVRPARCPPRASVPWEGAGPTGCPGGGLRRARGRHTVAGHQLVGVAAPGERADLALRVHRAHRRPGQRVPDPARPRRPPPRRSRPPGLRASRFRAGAAAGGWHPCGAPPRTLVALARRLVTPHITAQRGPSGCDPPRGGVLSGMKEPCVGMPTLALAPCREHAPPGGPRRRAAAPDVLVAGAAAGREQAALVRRPCERLDGRRVRGAAEDRLGAAAARAAAAGRPHRDRVVVAAAGQLPVVRRPLRRRPPPVSVSVGFNHPRSHSMSR